MAVTIKINPCPERYNSANPYKTGQTTSYATGDDGDLERGRGSDFTTLDFNNPFGNTNRFTDTTGAQTYANDILIDWASADYVNEQVIGWYRVVQGGAGVTWATAMAAQPVAVGGYNDWYIPNFNEIILISKDEDGSLLDGSFYSSSATGFLWTSTTRSDVTSNAILHVEGRNFPGQASKTNNLFNYILLRYFTFTELGL